MYFTLRADNNVFDSTFRILTNNAHLSLADKHAQ